MQYIDVAPSQMVGVSAGLIPFLEHDDANRALMGSNMQRQAVPLLITEPPLVATGLEVEAALNSSMIVRAQHKGVVTKVDAEHIEIGPDVYKLRKFVGLNERTCQNQKPIVAVGDKIEKGQVIADGAGTYKGELALGRNVLVAFMAWDGFNFEDAIIISEELVENDVYTSIHIEEFDIEIRETKLGREEFTRDIPNVSEKQLRNLDENGIVRVGTFVRPGDILVGKVSPKSKTELTPEEKLLHAIFGRAGEDVKNDSLEVPSGVEGIVIGTQKFSRRMSLTEDERKTVRERPEGGRSQGQRADRRGLRRIGQADRGSAQEKAHRRGRQSPGRRTRSTATWPSRRTSSTSSRSTSAARSARPRWKRSTRTSGRRWKRPSTPGIGKLNSMKRGDELRSGVLQMVKVYIAAKRVISVGDKMAGRHGNKGVIAKILPKEDMPFLADGTPVQILLNPLGVPSRMNVGQILETHLGWAAAALGIPGHHADFRRRRRSRTSASACKEAGLPENGKAQLYDGRTGEPFEQHSTVGQIYMMKLHHLVDDKVHARSTGPYSLITQQPLGGKARFGGQRFGEMEVWALEAYGAAYILQELLDRQERRRGRPHEDLRSHGQGRKHPRSRHARQLRRVDQRNPRPGVEHAIGKSASV